MVIIVWNFNKNIFLLVFIELSWSLMFGAWDNSININLKNKRMEQLEFTEKGVTLVFYQKPYDEKYSFLVKDNPALTESILKLVNKKRMKKEDISYAKKAIFDIISSNKLSQKEQVVTDYVSLVNNKLNQTQSIEELPVEVNQRANTVTLTILFGDYTITKTALNKKLAKQLCFKEILDKKLV